ncbi:MAG: hypothetical protein HC938_06215 [Nitrospira sp.]|nr:hypothetical protein [Nitrospira sp.]
MARIGSEFHIIPVPGHTAGSMALLYRERFLFTGDHLWWDPRAQSLEAPTRLIWRKWTMLDSLRKLLDYHSNGCLPDMAIGCIFPRRICEDICWHWLNVGRRVGHCDSDAHTHCTLD